MPLFGSFPGIPTASAPSAMLELAHPAAAVKTANATTLRPIIVIIVVPPEFGMRQDSRREMSCQRTGGPWMSLA